MEPNWVGISSDKLIGINAIYYGRPFNSFLLAIYKDGHKLLSSFFSGCLFCWRQFFFLVICPIFLEVVIFFKKANVLLLT
jgi:hypothetical protein